VVEFMQGDAPQAGWVLDESGGKLRLLTLNKREMKLPASRVLPWSGPCPGAGLNREEALGQLAERHRRREELAERVDALEIWELAQGEVESAEPEWFAGLVFEEPDADSLAAVGRKLLATKTHFKFRPPRFEIFPREKAEARVEEERAAAERRKILDAAAPFFKKLWSVHSSGGPPPDGPDAPEIAEKLKSMVLEAMAGEPEILPLWKEATKGLPDSPQLALHLARAWGLVSEHHNVLLEQEGYRWGDDWTGQFAERIEEHAARFESPGEVTDASPYVSVDSSTTRDVDDAFFMSRSDDGFELRLALACPALHWDFGGELDLAVRERASSLYLPEGTSFMLPERLAAGACSLAAGENRPAMVLAFRLDAEMRPVQVTPSLEVVRLAENATYEAVEERLESGEADESAILAAELSKLLRERRVAGGAVIIERTEPKVVLREGRDGVIVDLERPEECPRAQLLVSELMILANSWTAKWAGEQDLPLLHRTQDIALPPDAAGVWEEPQDVYNTVKLLGATLLEPDPAPHASLGVRAYCPTTSPLRRYSDFLNQGQIIHYLRHGRPRWEQEELGRRLPYLSARLEAASRIQRFRPRYWKLVYLKQRPEAHYPSIVVETNQLVTASIPSLQIYVRAPKDIFGDKTWPGQRFLVRLDKVHPLENEIRVAEAVEE
jgi:exoribonuclease-2